MEHKCNRSYRHLTRKSINLKISSSKDKSLKIKQYNKLPNLRKNPSSNHSMSKAKSNWCDKIPEFLTKFNQLKSKSLRTCKKCYLLKNVLNRGSNRFSRWKNFSQIYKNKLPHWSNKKMKSNQKTAIWLSKIINWTWLAKV